MKIAVIGTQNIGKSTYVNDFIKKWPMYETPDVTYRDVIKKQNLPHSKNGTEESQTLILNSLVDQIINSSKKNFVIFDRCVLDVLAYSTWLCINDKISEKFVDQQRIIIRETLKLYDILFFIPLTNVSKVEIVDDGLRDIDPEYRKEIDNIFKAFQDSYHRGDGRIFPKDDTPPIIEIFGNPDERIKLTEFYINSNGKQYGEQESLLNTIIPANEDDLKTIESNILKG
jgi:GTPase SAR1 family protein